MNDTRRKRLEKQILRLVADLSFKGLKNPDIGFVTFTECSLTIDGSYARIKVSVYEEGEYMQMKSIHALNSAVGFIRKRIAKNIPLRVIPQINFILDTSLADMEKMNNILDSHKPDKVDSNHEGDFIDKDTEINSKDHVQDNDHDGTHGGTHDGGIDK
jgi:ribosome-binding factor A